MDDEDRSGHLLSSRYRLEQRLGSGGMGHVYRAQNELIGREVAIKLLRSEYAESVPIVERFLREARAANLVRHPNVVDVLDIGQDDDGSVFIVQELLHGEDLAEFLARQGGTLESGLIVDILCPVVEAIAEAHAKGVLHRDLKPENVFLSKQGDTVVPKLLDFGISHISQGDVRKTQAGEVMGTPAYMAPEQVRGAREVDGRSDIWALGVMIFELASGRLPFEGADPPAMFVAIATEPAPRLTDVAPNAPSALARIVDKCLQKRPEDRYASASALRDDLRALAAVGDFPSAPLLTAADEVERSAESLLPQAPDLVLDLGQAAARTPAPPPPVLSPPPERLVLAETVAQPSMMSGLMLDASPSSFRPAASYEARVPGEDYEETSGSLIAGAILTLVAGGGLAAATFYHRSPDGWHVAKALAMTVSNEVHLLLQLGGGALCIVVGLGLIFSGYQKWTLPHGRSIFGAIVMALLAAGALFAALELVRGGL